LGQQVKASDNVSAKLNSCKVNNTTAIEKQFILESILKSEVELNSDIEHQLSDISPLQKIK